MPIPEEHLALAMDLRKSIAMSLDECHIALREAYADLTDEQFHARPIDGRHNVCTIVLHVLQQHDSFNAILQECLGTPARRGWQFLEHEERFRLWGLPADKLPAPGQPFPGVAEVLAQHDALHQALVANLRAVGEDELFHTAEDRWPRRVDVFFRGLWHAQVHVRQIWLMRGAMGLTGKFPEQHYA